VEVLSRRTIRDKLLRYFALQCGAAGIGSFHLPFTLSALAEYISTDRSAMMRELRKLREEGIVEISGRKVTFRGETPA
jgi:CRP-like cAMP-binding protein